ncbi:MAG: hypothetical protein NVV83_22090 [Afipia sp.]|nr:hypothetical protein [Afipia sp.]
MLKWLSLLAVLTTSVILNLAAEAETRPPEVLILRQLPNQPALRQKITEAIERLNGVSPSELTAKQAMGFDALAEMIISTSSVEKSPSGRFIVLYSTLIDLFTIIGTNKQSGPEVVYLAHGDALNYVVGKGRISEDSDFALRTFRQRPKLQRDTAILLEKDEDSMRRDILALQQDEKAAKIVTTALMAYVQSVNDYLSSTCVENIDAYRGSETFALRFTGGKKVAERMIPRVMVRISNVDNVILQDDQLGREFAFLETTPAPSCQVKKARIFFSY